MTEHAAESSAKVAVDLDEKKRLGTLHVKDRAKFVKNCQSTLETFHTFQRECMAYEGWQL